MKAKSTPTKRESRGRRGGKDAGVEEEIGRSKTPLRGLFRRSVNKGPDDVETSSVRSSPSSVIADLNLSPRAALKEMSCNYDLNPSLLYKLIEYNAWDEVIERVALNPAEAETWVVRYDEDKKPSWKMLPLHTAMLFHAPITVVQAIYRAFPQAASLPDDRNMLPVHVACRVRVDTVVMQFLVDAFPSALEMVDYKGRTPLDILKLDRINTGGDEASEALIELIDKYLSSRSIDFEGIETTGSGVLQADIEVDYDTNPTALIRFIESKNWEDAILRCRKMPREAASWLCRYQNMTGKRTKELRWKILPIHSAVVLNAPKSVIQALIEAFPDGLRLGDDRNMLPLHMAFRLGVDLEVCALLIQSYPQALQHKDNKGNAPMQILKAYRKKYMTADLNGVHNKNDIDRRRKFLIDYYLEGRYYRGDSIKDEHGIALYDSDYDSYTAFTDSERDDDSYSSGSESQTDENRLFYHGILKDFMHYTLKGFLNAPKIMCACDTRNLEEPKEVLRCGENRSYRPT